MREAKKAKVVSRKESILRCEMWDADESRRVYKLIASSSEVVVKEGVKLWLSDHLR